MTDTIVSIQGDEKTGSFYQIALDLIEGVVAGGVIGVGMAIIAGAVAGLPHAFITPDMVAPFAIITGALAFTGVAIHQIRKRL